MVVPFSDPARRLKASVILTYGSSFSNASVTHNGWGNVSDMWNGTFSHERFTTLDSISFGEGLMVLSETGQLPGVDVGLFSPPADANGNVNFSVTLTFSPVLSNQFNVYFNDSYGPPLQFVFTCWYFDTIVQQFAGGAEQYVFSFALNNLATINKITLNITKTLPFRRLNVTEISLKGGAIFEENRISAIKIVEEMIPRGYGTIAEKQIEVEFRNEDNLFGEAYIPEWARQDATLTVKIHTDDEEVKFDQLIPVSFVARRNKTATLVATDKMRKLKEALYAFAPANSTLTDIVSAVCSYYGVPYLVPPWFSNQIVPVPILGPTGFDTLCDVAAASNTICFCDRTGKIVFYALGAGGDTYTLQQEHIINSSRELSERFVYNVIRVAANTVVIEPTTTIVSQTLSIHGKTDLIFDFGSAYTDVQISVSGATVLETKKGNYGVFLSIQGSGPVTITITGKPIKLQQMFVQVQDDQSISQFGRQLLVVQTPLIQSLSVARTIAEGILNTYPLRAKLLRAQTVYPYVIKPNDVVVYENARYVVRRMQITLEKGLRAELDCLRNVS